MNLLSCTHTSADLTASGIVSAFKGLWSDSWGPRMEYILFSAVLTLLECPNMTLLGLNQLLSNDTYRAWVLRQINDPFLLYFWTREYEEYDPRFRREAIAPIQNKAGRFLQSPVVRNILGQVRNKVDFPFIMDNGRIFIANLSKGKLGEDKANLLGSLLTTQFQLAAVARAGRPEEARTQYHLIIDEFQNFSSEIFASILSEARKYRLCLTLSHQYIDQLSLPVRQAVFGNVGTVISFRVGHGEPSHRSGDTATAGSDTSRDVWQCRSCITELVRGKRKWHHSSTASPRTTRAPSKNCFSEKAAVVIQFRRIQPFYPFRYMDPQREKFLNLKNPPARLNADEAAWYLGFAVHDIPVLVSKGLLKPLGHPANNAVKYFALATLQELRNDSKWLARATDTVTGHWRQKNSNKPTELSHFIPDQKLKISS
jgi:hypothetical protein